MVHPVQYTTKCHCRMQPGSKWYPTIWPIINWTLHFHHMTIALSKSEQWTKWVWVNPHMSPSNRRCVRCLVSAGTLLFRFVEKLWLNIFKWLFLHISRHTATKTGLHNASTQPVSREAMHSLIQTGSSKFFFEFFLGTIKISILIIECNPKTTVRFKASPWKFGLVSQSLSL